MLVLEGATITAKDLSLILPCYNEERIFSDSMPKIKKILDKTGLDYEIIFVDDKSCDSTALLIKKFLRSDKKSRAIFHGKNTGRGGAVVDGLKIAKGKYAGFIDIDLEVSEKYIPEMVKILRQGNDVACAVRHYNASLNIFRNFLHNMYLVFANAILSLPVSDPNGGYKFFRLKRILPILSKTSDTHWFWETEVLKRASLAGLKIKEIDVVYVPNTKKKSTVSIFSDTWHFISKVFWLRKKLKEEAK